MPKVLLVVLVVLGVCSCVASVVGLTRTDRPSPPAEAAQAVDAGSHPVVPPVPAARAASVLTRWDAARARAWAQGDAVGLASLYAPGSAAGSRDVAMLRAWTGRGLVVRGLHTQLLAVLEVRRTAGRWVLRVTDRLVGGVAVGGGVRAVLPSDVATTRTVTLMRSQGEWVVASVLPASGRL